MGYYLYMIINGREVLINKYLFRKKAEKIKSFLEEKAKESKAEISLELRKEKWKI